jgi:poly(A) polymerase
MLGVHFPETDIDVICIFRQKFVAMNDFFTDFVKTISHEDQTEFTQICIIGQARVPIIKFKLFEVQFDVLFASVDDFSSIKRIIDKPNFKQADQNQIKEEWRRLSETTQNSFYGRIACNNLKRVVGSDIFKLVLRAVRFWAMQRGLYSTNMGYFSGITLAVMVAKICQDFAGLEPACLLYKFFDFYAEFAWREPVCIVTEQKRKSKLRIEHLDAVDQFSNDVMVVLTPNDQLRNTAYRVNDHNFYAICQELQRAQQIVHKLAPKSLIRHEPTQRPREVLTVDVDEDSDNLMTGKQRHLEDMNEIEAGKSFGAGSDSEPCGHDNPLQSIDTEEP